MARTRARDTRSAARSPVTTGPDQVGPTGEGGAGYARDLRSEVFLLAVSHLGGADTFYESAEKRDTRYAHLVGRAAVADPEWTAAFLGWLRDEGNLRTAALVGAAEFVHARLTHAGERAESAAPAKGAAPAASNRRVVASVLQRADEPGEMLAYWTAVHGRAVPKAVKRGVADAVVRLYDEHALLKYDSRGRGFRFGDVIDVVHPSPRDAGQGDLFRHALDRRHRRDDPIPESLRVLAARADLTTWTGKRKRKLLARADAATVLRGAGMTWESLAGWLQGPMDAAAWSAVIPTMGYMALLRNLRNFDQAGVPDEVAATVAARLADPEQVARSRQLPMRFLSAHRAAPSPRWGPALEQALQASLVNVPALPGRTLVLVDRSGSMWDRLSARSNLTRADAAAIFGTAVALRSAKADLVAFGTDWQVIPVRPDEPLLPVIARFGQHGGTNTAEAVAANYRGHDRIVIVTDEQAAQSGGQSVSRAVPWDVPLYTWNLAGYRRGHSRSGTRNRHTFGGLSDVAFRMIPLLERGHDARWPWEDGR